MVRKIAIRYFAQIVQPYINTLYMSLILLPVKLMHVFVCSALIFKINAEFLRITTVPLEAKFFASFDKHSSKLLELIRKKAGVVKERTASILQILDEVAMSLVC